MILCTHYTQFLPVSSLQAGTHQFTLIGCFDKHGLLSQEVLSRLVGESGPREYPLPCLSDVCPLSLPSSQRSQLARSPLASPASREDTVKEREQLISQLEEAQEKVRRSCDRVSRVTV